MATTVVACALRFDRAVIAHVGDSRCYLIRHGHAKQLTKDHTVVNDQLRLGILTAREAAENQNKHLLSRSVGADLFVNVDTTDTQSSLATRCCSVRWLPRRNSRRPDRQYRQQSRRYRMAANKRRPAC